MIYGLIYVKVSILTQEIERPEKREDSSKSCRRKYVADYNANYKENTQGYGKKYRYELEAVLFRTALYDSHHQPAKK